MLQTFLITHRLIRMKKRLNLYSKKNDFHKFKKRVFGNYWNLFAFKNPIGCSVLPSIARSASISPTIETNLKP